MSMFFNSGLKTQLESDKLLGLAWESVLCFLSLFSFLIFLCIVDYLKKNLSTAFNLIVTIITIIKIYNP
jgi:hypothetical protein